MSVLPMGAFSRAPSFRLTRHLLSRACLSLMGAAILGGVASASDLSLNAAFNPERLPASALHGVQQICQSRMGLNPKEPLTTVWGGAVNPGLVGGENHFQGCVASLSGSLRDVAQQDANLRADADCRARGASVGSSELANCVLSSLKDQTAPSLQTISDGPTHGPALRPGSFYTASPGEVQQREQRACADLGLNPAYGAFDACVKSMDRTFFSIDNPRN